MVLCPNFFFFFLFCFGVVVFFKIGFLVFLFILSLFLTNMSLYGFNSKDDSDVSNTILLTTDDVEKRRCAWRFIANQQKSVNAALGWKYTELYAHPDEVRVHLV